VNERSDAEAARIRDAKERAMESAGRSTDRMNQQIMSNNQENKQAHLIANTCTSIFGFKFGKTSSTDPPQDTSMLDRDGQVKTLAEIYEKEHVMLQQDKQAEQAIYTAAIDAARDRTDANLEKVKVLADNAADQHAERTRQAQDFQATRSEVAKELCSRYEDDTAHKLEELEIHAVQTAAQLAEEVKKSIEWKPDDDSLDKHILALEGQIVQARATLVTRIEDGVQQGTIVMEECQQYQVLLEPSQRTSIAQLTPGTPDGNYVRLRQIRDARREREKARHDFMQSNFEARKDLINNPRYQGEAGDELIGAGAALVELTKQLIQVHGKVLPREDDVMVELANQIQWAQENINNDSFHTAAVNMKSFAQGVVTGADPIDAIDAQGVVTGANALLFSQLCNHQNLQSKMMAYYPAITHDFTLVLPVQGSPAEN